MHAFPILILSLKVELKENVMCNEPRLCFFGKNPNPDSTLFWVNQKWNDVKGRNNESENEFLPWQPYQAIFTKYVNKKNSVTS